MRAVRNVGKTFMWNHHYLLKCILLCIVCSSSVSMSNKNITVVRGADVILYCSLNGTFTLPEWHGPPGERIYTMQNNTEPYTNISSVKEKRLDWLNNDHVNLKIQNVSDKDAGTYACIAGLGTYRFNLVVTELDVTEPVTITNSASINMPKQEGSKEAPVWPAPVAILGGWLVICIVLLCLVQRSIENDIFSKSIVFVVLLIVSCVFVIGWIYIIWCLSKNCRNPGKNVNSNLESEEEVKFMKPLKTPATRFIQDKTPIKDSGNIRIYSLECTKVTDASNRPAEIKKYIIGSRSERGHRKRTIMLVEAANTGKRTLIDGMVNYCMGVQFQHPFRLTFFEDKYMSKQVSNGSGWIAHYIINPERGSRLNYPLHIIDTKGYENTTDAPGKCEKELIKNFLSGEKRDNENVCIDALCLLLRSTDTELTNQHNYLKSILELPEIHHSVKICYLITYADSDDVPAHHAINVARFPNEKTFTFSNSIIFNEKGKPDDVKLNEQLWNKLERNFKSFFEFINKGA